MKKREDDDSDRLWPGHTADLRRTSLGTTIKPRNAFRQSWQHPWQLDVRWQDGQWRAFVNPGFVNARPAFIHMPATWFVKKVEAGAKPQDFGINPLTGQPYFSAWVFPRESATPSGERVKGTGGPVRLTNRPEPYLILDEWRNPAASSDLTDTGRAAAAEGYPRFFDRLGVRPASKGGPLLSIGSSGDDVTGRRTREIRAMDVVLRQPRASTGLFTQPGNPVAGTAFLEFQTTYSSAPDSRSILRAVRKYIPSLGVPEELGTGIPGIFNFLLNQGDAQFDEMLMATVWMVSPPDTVTGVPDETWEAYVQHRVWWNLSWANKVAIEDTGNRAPIVLPIPLAGGVAQPLVDFVLGSINQGLSEAINFLALQLAARVSGGRFWTT